MDDCIKKNPGKKDPAAYCATIKRKVEGKSIFKFRTDNIKYKAVDENGVKRHYISGYISTKHIDFDNELVTDECMEKMVRDLKTKSIKLDVEHEAFRDNPNIIPVGKIVEAHKDDKGVWVTAELNPASPKFKSVWESIKNGFIDAFSIAYNYVDTVVKQVRGKSVTLLNEITLLNVALTGVPVNDNCKIGSVFMKSIGDCLNECNNDLNGDIQDNMESKIMVDEPKDEPSTDEPKPAADEPKVDPATEPAKPGDVPDADADVSSDSDKDVGTKAKANEENKEIVALKSKVDELTTKVTELEKKLDAPMLKAKVEPTPSAMKSKTDTEGTGPLDVVGV